MTKDRKMEDRRKGGKEARRTGGQEERRKGGKEGTDLCPSPVTLQLEATDDPISPRDYNGNTDDPRLAVA